MPASLSQARRAPRRRADRSTTLARDTFARGGVRAHGRVVHSIADFDCVTAERSQVGRAAVIRGASGPDPFIPEETRPS